MRYIRRVLNTDWIKSRREALSLTQEQAAEAAGLKSKQHWYAVESGATGGKSGITLGTLNAIAKALKCDPKELLK